MIRQLIVIGALALMSAKPPPSGHPLRVAVIGNSLVRHGPSEAIGWAGNWGMAATAESNDFAHVLATLAHAQDGREVELTIIPAASFESQPDQFDLAALPAADLYVLRLGDNVRMSADEFAPHYARMAAALRARTGVLVCVGMWYPNAELEAAMQAGCAGGRWVAISDMAADTGFLAGAQRFSNSAVASHPGDSGHAEIARRVLAAALAGQKYYVPMFMACSSAG